MTRKRLNKNLMEFIFQRENGRCFYCSQDVVRAQPGDDNNQPNLATGDHIIPRSMGGLMTRGNMVLACLSCNSERQTMNASEFLAMVKARPEVRKRDAALARAGVAIETKRERLAFFGQIAAGAKLRHAHFVEPGSP